MNQLEEYMRFPRRKKKKQLQEYSTDQAHNHDVIRNGKESWKAFRRLQNQLREEFPGLIKKDTKEVKKE